MKFLACLAFVCNLIEITAQNAVSPTNTLHLYGKVEKEITYTLEQLDTFPATAVPDLVLSNHKGEIKDTLRGMKGIPLKRLLATLVYTNQNPKELNEFYFVFIASDGYKVVFSWNEIYNTAAGEHLYLITEMKGKRMREIAQRLLFLASDDLKTGRRYIKGLEKIEVRRVE